MIKAAIIGGSGYTGVELLRILVNHPSVTINAITSRSQVGQKISNTWPQFRGHIETEFCAPDSEAINECDIVFFATPNGEAMQRADKLLKSGIKVIDLSADFRLRDAKQWQQWYGQEHKATNILPKAIYGLTEWQRDNIKSAQLIANPGCYPTATLLGLLPLVEKYPEMLKRIIVDAKSGLSGAGRQAGEKGLLCEAGSSIKPYGIDGHRHHPEISQGIHNIATKNIDLIFIPHLMPTSRGILATIYIPELPTKERNSLIELYQTKYKNEHFIDILNEGEVAETRFVTGTNRCHIAVCQSYCQSDTAVITVAIDNLVKGAAGQAIQNMNIMFGFPEQTSLNNVALTP